MGRRRSAALEMAENRDAHIVARIFFLDALGQRHGSAGDGAFGHEHYRRVLALAEAVLDKFGKLVDLGRYLGNDGRFGAGGDSAVEGEESGVAPHDFDKEEALVAGRCVADFVDTFHNGVQSGVVAYRRVGSVEVVVDCARQSDDRQVEFVGEDSGACQRAVAADNDEGVDFVAAQVVVGELATFGGLEFLASGRLQNRSAAVYDVRDVLGLEFLDFIGDEAAVAAVDSFDFESAVDGRARDGADCGVHSGGVASGGQDADTFDL